MDAAIVHSWAATPGSSAPSVSIDPQFLDQALEAHSWAATLMRMPLDRLVRQSELYELVALMLEQAVDRDPARLAVTLYSPAGIPNVVAGTPGPFRRELTRLARQAGNDRRFRLEEIRTVRHRPPVVALLLPFTTRETDPPLDWVLAVLIDRQALLAR